MRRWLCLLLLLATLINACALTACVTPTTPDDDSTQNDTESGDGVQGSDEGNGDSDNNGENLGENIKNPDKYGDLTLSEQKLREALNEAISKIDIMTVTFSGNQFPDHNSTNNVYPAVKNTKGWNAGFWTGMLWHAYELTDNKKYKEHALWQIPAYTERIDEKLSTDTHDMGFVYTPSCVAAYKITGNAEAKETALKAADQLLSRYHSNGQYIQAWGKMGSKNNYRLIVDCLMNIPLLYWASEETGQVKYRNAAYNHFNTTLTNCFREDGSTYHTYFFDPVTGAPLRGATHQGVSDDSTWARGQAWAIYGTMLTYGYEKNSVALTAFKEATEYFLDHLPSDYVPYWDFTYGDGAFEPKDSSSAAIAICGILEGLKYMDKDDPLYAKFSNAAKRMMNSLIDNYTTKDVESANGLLLHGTYNHNSNMGVDEMVIWGDYFYMEALHRMLDPDWELYW